MLVDLTLRITPQLRKLAEENLKKASGGHLGTHFDVMDKEFPLEYTRRHGVVFDISAIAAQQRDVEIADIDMARVQPDMFVGFASVFIEHKGYGSAEYFAEHPQLSHALIEALAQRGISIIGVDFSGVRCGKEHTAADQYCADRGVFIVENLCNMKTVADAGGDCIVNTYPLNFSHLTGLPCRVVAELDTAA